MTKKETMVTVLFKRPNEDEQVIKVVDTLQMFQKMVDGPIETLTLTNGIVLVCNENGKLREDCLPNFYLPDWDETIVGNVFFLAHDKDGDLKSLTDEQIDYIKEKIICKSKSK